MPYKSEAQRQFFNSPAGKEKIGEKEVEHWNEVSKGKKLLEKVEEDKRRIVEMKAIDKAIKLCDAVPSQLSGLKWPNGMPIDEDSMIKVIAYNYAETYGEAKEDLKKIDKSTMQRFIKYYADKH